MAWYGAIASAGAEGARVRNQELGIGRVETEEGCEGTQLLLSSAECEPGSVPVHRRGRSAYSVSSRLHRLKELEGQSVLRETRRLTPDTTLFSQAPTLKLLILRKSQEGQRDALAVESYQEAHNCL